MNLILNEKANEIIVIRHAHRMEAKLGSFGNESGLTTEGAQAALSLGQTMKNTKLGEVHTSPVFRCEQTANLILSGALQNPPVFYSQNLGNPGVFIENPAYAESAFLHFSPHQIAQKIADGETIPGMRSLTNGGECFLEYTLGVKKFPCLMITHDIIICLLCCFFFQSKEAAKYFPDFLKGFSLNTESKQVSLII